jgi:recombination protein RecA
MIVIDSVAALVPRAEIEGEMGDSHMGLQARLMSQALRKLTGTINRSKTLVVFINQIRMKIGVMFGNPETTTGGNALKFYASVRLDIRRIQALKDGENVIGNRTRVKVVKNKMAPPFKEVEFDILYGEGISKEGDYLDLGANLGVVEKSGTWYSYKEERIGQGREKARDYLKQHPEMMEAIRKEVMVKANIGQPKVAATAAPAGASATAPAGASAKHASDSKLDAKHDGKHADAKHDSAKHAVPVAAAKNAFASKHAASAKK